MLCIRIGVYVCIYIYIPSLVPRPFGNETNIYLASRLIYTMVEVENITKKIDVETFRN